MVKVKDKYDLFRFDSSGAVPGNIFLTNIHHVYFGKDVEPSPDDEDTMDYFLGKRFTDAITDSKINFGDIGELVALNDEAHHIHDPKIAWFKLIEEQREIIFKDITTGKINHTTILDSGAVTDYRSAIEFFTQVIMKDL